MNDSANFITLLTLALGFFEGVDHSLKFILDPDKKTLRVRFKVDQGEGNYSITGYINRREAQLQSLQAQVEAQLPGVWKLDSDTLIHETRRSVFITFTFLQ